MVLMMMMRGEKKVIWEVGERMSVIVVGLVSTNIFTSTVD